MNVTGIIYFIWFCRKITHTIESRILWIATTFLSVDVFFGNFNAIKV